MDSERMDELVIRLVHMDRPALIAALKAMDCGFPVDFTEEYLDSISLERLKHIVLVASLRDRHCAEIA